VKLLLWALWRNEVSVVSASDDFTKTIAESLVKDSGSDRMRIFSW